MALPGCQAGLSLMSESGITTAVLKGANAPRFVAPDMSQDHLESNQGDFGALDLQVEHVSPPREAIRRLPGHLEVSPHN